MLQYYTLIKTKNKMKDFEIKYEEWWEVVEKYFAKELEKNLAQHRVDEKILRYKLKAYKKNFCFMVMWLGTSQRGELWEKKMILRHIVLENAGGVVGTCSKKP